MSNYTDVRGEAKRRGPLPPEASSPIPILPSREYVVTRLITVPVFDDDGRKMAGRFMHRPAEIIVKAFSAGEACARADEVQLNKNIELWGHGSKPWDDGRGSWRKIELPSNIEPLVLR